MLVNLYNDARGMSVRTCQLCGKPLGRIRVGAGDFCSREHRNQFRLRRSMDHLLEANKVASLMRRRENPKQIPLAQLLVSSAMEPRDAVTDGLFPAGQVQFDFRPLRPLLVHLAIGASRGYLSLATRGTAPLAHHLDDPAALPFTLHRSSRAALPGRQTPQSPARLQRASMASIPCQLPGPGIAHRECEAVLRVKRRAVFEFRPSRTTAPGSNYVDRKRQPHLTPQLRDIPAQERASVAPPERRRPAPRAFRCAARPRPELPLAPPRGYDLLSIAIFSDPRFCDPPTVEQVARIRPLCVPPPIHARPPQSPLPLQPAGAAAAAAAQVCEPDWKTEKRSPSHRLRPSIAAAIDFGARPPVRMAGAFTAQSVAYQVTEVPFAPPDSAFDYTPIALHGTLTAFAAEAPAAPAPAALEEDFNSGLGRWVGDTAGWKLDVAGARPAGLALLEPSLTWTNYDFEFLTRIAKRGVTFVVRASDVNNYHRITIGPAESGGYEVRRSLVIAGNEEPLPAMPAGQVARSSSAITVKTRVEGGEFTISIEGEVVARGTEERLPAGGIGFTSLSGEQARVYWARLTPLAGSISEAAPGRPPRSIS
jgi:hypothetical protein